MSRWFNEGRDAHASGAARADNPYGKGWQRARRRLWTAGWDAEAFDAETAAMVAHLPTRRERFEAALNGPTADEVRAERSRSGRSMMECESALERMALARAVVDAETIDDFRRVLGRLVERLP